MIPQPGKDSSPGVLPSVNERRLREFYRSTTLSSVSVKKRGGSKSKMPLVSELLVIDTARSAALTAFGYYY